MNNSNNNYNSNTNIGNQNVMMNEPKLTVEDIENMRIDAKNKVIKNAIIFSIISIIAYIILLVVFRVKVELIFYFLFFSGVLAFLLSFPSVKKFKSAYKKYFAVSIFEKRCENVNFDLERGIDQSVIANTQMMRMGDRFHSNDYISGKYKSVNFEYSDVHIENEYEDSEGRTHYETLFRGQWFIFDFNKNFKSNLQICEKDFRNAKRNSWFGADKYKKVELEDIDFNKKFKVFAQNDLEAFYILTPHTIEKIKLLNNNMYGSLLFCFVDNRLHVGLHSGRDSFEASIFKTIDENQEKSKVIQEIDTILNFIDVLNLDNTLFK